MKKIKKMLAVGAAALCIAGSAMPAMADTVSYDWRFTNEDTTYMTGSGFKDDNEQNWYLTISGGNVTSLNVFGTRVRRSTDAAMVSSYVTNTSKVTGKRYAYTSSVNTVSKYELRGKKDDSSTTPIPLDVSGRVTY